MKKSAENEWFKDPSSDSYGWPNEIEHLNGVPWNISQVPKRFHRHKAQTRGSIKFDYYERCSCGAIKHNNYKWKLSNSRKDHKKSKANWFRLFSHWISRDDNDLSLVIYVWAISTFLVLLSGDLIKSGFYLLFTVILVMLRIILRQKRIIRKSDLEKRALRASNSTLKNERSSWHC